jgi:transcriptional regulator with XRE-family HTH domain
MITSGQLRAARALIAIDQRELAARSGLAVPTIHRMEASEGVIRGTVGSLMKLIAALDAAGIELIGEGAVSHGSGRGVRLKSPRADGKAYRRKAQRTG